MRSTGNKCPSFDSIDSYSAQGVYIRNWEIKINGEQSEEKKPTEKVQGIDSERTGNYVSEIKIATTKTSGACNFRDDWTREGGNLVLSVLLLTRANISSYGASCEEAESVSFIVQLRIILDYGREWVIVIAAPPLSLENVYSCTEEGALVILLSIIETAPIFRCLSVLFVPVPGISVSFSHKCLLERSWDISIAKLYKAPLCSRGATERWLVRANVNWKF